MLIYCQAVKAPAEISGQIAFCPVGVTVRNHALHAFDIMLREVGKPGLGGSAVNLRGHICIVGTCSDIHGSFPHLAVVLLGTVMMPEARKVIIRILKQLFLKFGAGHVAAGSKDNAVCMDPVLGTVNHAAGFDAVDRIGGFVIEKLIGFGLQEVIAAVFKDSIYHTGEVSVQDITVVPVARSPLEAGVEAAGAEPAGGAVFELDVKVMDQPIQHLAAAVKILLYDLLLGVAFTVGNPVVKNGFTALIVLAVVLLCLYLWRVQSENVAGQRGGSSETSGLVNSKNLQAVLGCGCCSGNSRSAHAYYKNFCFQIYDSIAAGNGYIEVLNGLRVAAAGCKSLLNTVFDRILDGIAGNGCSADCINGD